MSSVRNICGTQGCGVIHDLYNPGNVDMINTLVDYTLHNTSAGIPILFVEEVCACQLCRCASRWRGKLVD